MREDVGEVTTNLERPATRNSRSHMPYDSFEWQEPPPSNGVPRSAWTRSHRRLSRWHRPYTVVLVVLDFLSAVLASSIAISLLEQAKAGFQNQPEIFRATAYLLLPAAWVIVLWGVAVRDVAPSAMGL
jgi:hypothetical protein